MQNMIKYLGIKGNNTMLFDCDEIIVMKNLKEVGDVKRLIKYYEVEINLLDEMSLHEFSFESKLGGKVYLEINGKCEDISRILKIYKMVVSNCNVTGFVEVLTSLGYEVKEPSFKLAGEYNI